MARPSSPQTSALPGLPVAPGWARAALWGLLVAQAVVVAAALHPWVTADTGDYAAMAEGLAAGGFGVLRDGELVPEAVRPPGYPLILAFLRHVLGLSWTAVVALQMAGYLVSVWLVEGLLRRRSLASWPLLALLLAYPAGAAYAAVLGSEGATILAVAGAAFLLAAPGEITMGRATGAGVLAGVAALIRPNLVLFPVVAALLVLLRPGGRDGAHPSVRTAGAVLVAAILVLAPYAARNAVVFGWPLPVPPATPAGTSLYLATWQERFTQADADAFYHGTVTPRMREIGFDTAVARINREMGLPPGTPPFTPTLHDSPDVQLRVTRTYRREALRRMVGEPGPYLRHLVRNVWRMWNTRAYPDALPGWVTALLAGVSGVVWAAGLGVAVACFVLPAPFWLRVSGAVVLYFLGVQLGLHTEARYTAPARLFLVLNAGVLPWWVGTRLRRTPGEP